MGCCGRRRYHPPKVTRSVQRYRLCESCKGPVYRRMRYDTKLKRYVEVDICPVCEREGSA